MWMLLMM
jgi:long-chain acyl-CoA synthetase